MNQWESIYYKEAESERIFSIWCENRRLFYFSPNGMQQQQQQHQQQQQQQQHQQQQQLGTSSSLFNSKSFNLNFVPPGLLSFLTISSDGSVEIFIQTESDSQDPNFTCFRVADPNHTNVSDAFASQRTNGKILIYLQSSTLISVFELEYSPENNFSLQLISQCPLITPSKFIWSEAKELFIQVEKSSEKGLKMNFFNYQDFSLVSSKTLEAPFEIGDIFHSSRAASYIFMQAGKKHEYVLMLNLNGEIVKKLTLEFVDYPNIPEFSKFNDCMECFETSALLISPNGLIVGKIAMSALNATEDPMVSQHPIGEINSKSKAKG